MLINHYSKVTIKQFFFFFFNETLKEYITSLQLLIKHLLIYVVRTFFLVDKYVVRIFFFFDEDTLIVLYI
jgi:hypothetical protein